MPASDIVNLDDYERKKLTILTFEKFNALFMCFGFVVFVLLCAIELWMDGNDLYVILIDRPPDVARIVRRDFFSLLFLLSVLPPLYAWLYYSRASAQSRPHIMRWVSIAVFPAVPAFAYAVYANPSLREFYIFIWRLCTAHWASMFEVIVIFAAGTVISRGYSRGYWAMWRLTERDKIFVREDPEKGFYRGRVWRTALGIPRIIDLMPHRRFITMVLFVLANFFFALSIGWILVYAGFLIYRVAVVWDVYHGMVTHPYVQETAVSHMLYTLSVSFLFYCIPPIIGGYILTAARRNVHWSITQLLEADGRVPILFLRAFKDDQVQLQNVKLSLLGRTGRWLDGIGNLDRLLLDEGTPYGPVVAIGNPSDKFPPYGAARGYFDDKTWRAAVADLASNALAIIICLDRTEGIWWEVGHIARLGYLPKTLFLIHPKDSSELENRALAAEITKKLEHDAGATAINRQHETEASGDAQNGTLLGFFFDDNGVMHAGRSATFSRLAYLIQVRWFLRSKFGFAKVAA